MASLIYSSLPLYRLMMNLLYTGSYKGRMKQLSLLLQEQQHCLELCFGDTILASICKQKNMAWTGLDINNYFVHCALKRGYEAKQADVAQLTTLPIADVCVMAGSLYHFNENALSLITKMTTSAPRVIICEPVHNLSSRKGLLGWFARRSAGTSAGPAHFRYTRESFLCLMESAALATRRKLTIENEFKKDLTVSLHL